MLHSGKRKAPLSKLRGYLGYWAEKRDGENPTYYARIYFIFNQEVTFDYPNLSQEIEDAWNKAIKKKYANDDYDGIVKPIVLMKSVDLLNKKQLVVERINKRLQKLFFENVVPYVVFQNVIYSEFYTKTPKWLIRGTTPKK